VTRAEILTNAREAFRLGELDQAEALYRGLLADEPEDAMAHHMLGLIAHQRGDLEGAQRLIARSLAAQPDSAHAQQNLGIVQQKLGDAAGRRRAIAGPSPSRASWSWPASISPPCCSSRASRRGDQAAARGAAPCAGALRASQQSRLGADGAGRPAPAIAALRKAVDLAPRLAVTHRNLARALAETGRIDEAADRYRWALKIDPADAETLARLALAEQARGNLGEAAPLAAAGRFPGAGTCRRPARLGPLPPRGGRPVEAALAAREALALDPGAPEAYLDLAGILEDSGYRADALPSMTRCSPGAPAMARRWPGAPAACWRWAASSRPGPAPAPRPGWYPPRPPQAGCLAALGRHALSGQDPASHLRSGVRGQYPVHPLCAFGGGAG
jgi:Tfp pilus assembly protein PilF